MKLKKPIISIFIFRFLTIRCRLEIIKSALFDKELRMAKYLHYIPDDIVNRVYRNTWRRRSSVKKFKRDSKGRFI